MVIEAVIFDVGGVLEETPPTGWDQRWCGKLGLSRPEMLRRIGSIWEAGETGSLSLHEVELRTADALELDETALRTFMDDMWEEYLGSLNVAMAEFFAGLRARYRTGILSNSFVGARERERRAYNFEAMCDVVVYSHEEGIKKPDPRIYELVCERLGVRPEEVVFVDDTPACVEAARRIGMTAVVFVENEQAIGDIRSVLGSGVTGGDRWA